MSKKLRLALGGLLFALVLVYTVVSYAETALLFHMLDERGWNAAPEEPGGQQLVVRVDADTPAADVLREGDEVIRINDRNVERSDYKMESAFRPVGDGDAYTVTVRRDGEVREFTLRRGARSFLKFILQPAPIIILLSSFIYFVIGGFVFAVKPEDKQAVLLSLVLLTEGTSWALPPPFEGMSPWYVLLMAFGQIFRTLFPAFLLHLLLVFPEPSPILRRRPRLEWLLYVPVLVLPVAHAAYMVLLWATASVEWSEVAQRETLIGFGTTIVNVVYIGAGLLVLALKYRKTELVARRKLRLVFTAMLISLIPLGVWMLTLTFVPASHRYGGEGWMVVNVLLWATPFAFAYAIVRHQVIPVSLIIRRSVQYLFAKNALRVATALPIIGVALSIVLNHDRPLADILFRNSLYFYLSVALAAALGLVFRRRLTAWVDRKFFRETYNAEQILRSLTDEIKRLDLIPEMSKRVSEQIERALHPSRTLLFYREAERRDLSLSYTSGGSSAEMRIPAESRLLRFMEDTGGAQDFPFPTKNNLPADEKEWLRALDARLVVPMTGTDNRLAGLLVLGEKRSEVPYTASDRLLLEALAEEIALRYENVRLRERVERDRRIQHEVLSRVGGRDINLLKECPTCGRCYDAEAQRCEADAGELMLSLPVERTIESRYRLERVLGKGGMGAVYEAIDVRLNRTVAVKILSGSLFGDAAALRRFEREAQAAAKLSHPNIVQVHDYGATQTGGAYLVMELIAGCTLKAELQKHKTLSSEKVAELFDEVLIAIEAAHRAGVVHRDLKPENILLENRGEALDGIKVLDFGLAKFTQPDLKSTDSLTTPGMVMGTFGYMSPEQLTGRAVDERTDLFAVGVMVFESLTGRRPFEGRTIIELLHRIERGAFDLPAQTPTATSLEQALRRCLAPDPAARFCSADELRGELLPAIRTYRFAPAAAPALEAATMILDETLRYPPAG